MKITAKQIKDLNDLMMIHNSDVRLGDILEKLLTPTSAGKTISNKKTVEPIAKSDTSEEAGLSI